MLGHFNIRTASVIAAVLTLSGCAGGNYRPVSDTPVRIGRPYAVRGTTYTPAADPSYDMLGYASWYGNESGNRTANGERFRPRWITAAHTTLPLPTYVEVFVTGNGRIIDLSRGAADALGIKAQGHAPVRVRRIEPSEKDRARLRAGKPASELSPLPPTQLANLRMQLAVGTGQSPADSIAPPATDTPMLK